MVLELCIHFLQGLGYKVLSARTPGEAIRLAGEYPGAIDLLITDVIMPEINGKELANRLGAMRPGLRCLFMSGYMADVIASHGVLDKGVLFHPEAFHHEGAGGKDPGGAQRRGIQDRMILDPAPSPVAGQ